MTERTSRSPWGLIVALVSLLIFFACAGTLVGARGGLAESQVKSLPPEVGDAYALFARKCSRCHTLARPLSAQVNDFEHWREYVARMRRQPGSGISPDDGEVILQFLKYYLEHKAGIEALAPVSTSTVHSGGRP